MSEYKQKEIRRLHSLGFAIHLLKPRSKVPVKPGWSGDSKDSVKTLLKELKPNSNIGTKLGKPSLITTPFGDEGYLAVIDVDVKGTSEKHKRTAEAKVEEIFPGLLATAPITYSGRGNGSMHIWCLVDSPLDSKKITSSNEIIEVHMPSTKASKADIEKLGKKKTDAGIRLRAAWEIDFMCAGRQVVLPPSIHPDSGLKYRWHRAIHDVTDLSFVDMEQILSTHSTKNTSKGAGRPQGSATNAIAPVDPDMLELEMRLKPYVLDQLIDGDGVEDRSAACLSVAMHMKRAEFTDAEVVGVLTNRTFYLGDVAYEHAKTENRLRSSKWVEKYCLEKAVYEVSGAKDFEGEVEEYPTLPPEKAKAKREKLIKDKKERLWTLNLDRTEKGNVKVTGRNVVMIIENDVAPDVLRFDEFSYSPIFFRPNPWGSKVGSKVQDIDYIKCRLWIANKWKIEPSVNEVMLAFKAIAEKNMFHAVKEHLEALPEWDGVPRLTTWMKRLLGAEAPEPYLSEVSKKFLVSAIARVFEPGCKLDATVIFEGVQGLGKSTIGVIFATDKWFLDKLPDLHDKDAAQILQGNWFVEMGELSSIKRSDVETTKNYLTVKVDKFRPAYGHCPIESPRQCIFFGTTNSSDYLKDKSGNRRFWPIKVNNIDLEAVRLERDQLLAEALIAYDFGETLYLDKEVEAIANVVQSKRVVEDDSDVVFSTLYDWDKSIRKKREQLAKKGHDLKQLTFKVQDLFGEFMSDEFGENSKPPLNEFAKHPYKYQLAGGALKKLGYENYLSNGRMKWRQVKYTSTEK